MKSEQSSDEIAAAIGGFNSTENEVFDFIRKADFIALRLHPKIYFGISFEGVYANAIKSALIGGINLLHR